MQESTVDFLAKPFPVSSGHISLLTSDSTLQQGLDHVGAATFQHEHVLRVYASIMSKPPPAPAPTSVLQQILAARSCTVTEPLRN